MDGGGLELAKDIHHVLRSCCSQGSLNDWINIAFDVRVSVNFSSKHEVKLRNEFYRKQIFYKI